MGGEQKREVRVRGATGRCPYCHDLITDVRELVACAGCGARQHERCYEEHGTCSSCGGTDVLVSRVKTEQKQVLHPPKGSTIQVDEREGGTSYTWDTKKRARLLFVTFICALTFLAIPLLPFLWIWWFKQGKTKARVLLHDDGIDLKLERPFQKNKSVFAKRSEVGAIRLYRNVQFNSLRLTIDVGVDRIALATAGPGQPGNILKEPEVEWLYERLIAWKGQG